MSEGGSEEAPLILITNDDGAEEPGLAVLTGAARTVGEPLVFANDTRWNTAGTSLGIPTGQPRVRSMEAQRWLFADAPPALIVTAACSGVAGRTPDAAVVGVNRGPNVGAMTLHSGTVAAATTAAAFGIPAIAISSDDVYSTCGQEDGPRHDELAAGIGLKLMALVARHRQGIVFNLNVPNLPIKEVGGIRLASPGAAFPAAHIDPEGMVEVKVNVAESAKTDDVCLLSDGFATVTVLEGHVDTTWLSAALKAIEIELLNGEVVDALSPKSSVHEQH